MECTEQGPDTTRPDLRNLVSYFAILLQWDERRVRMAAERDTG
jgi:hypothetical protein